MKAIKNLFVLAGLVVAGLAIPAIAATEQPPAPGKPHNFNLSQPARFRLDNGMQATLVEYGHLPKVTVELVIRTGNLNEGDKTWLADFTGKLMDEGTTKHSAREVADLAASMGGNVSINVGADETTISGDVLAEKAPEMIALIGEIAQSPALPQAAVERVRNDLLRSLTIAKSRAQSEAQEAFDKEMYGSDHPYGRIFPTADQLKSYSVDDARSYYEKNFGAQRSHLYVVGEFDVSKVRKAVADTFDAWKKGPGMFIDIPDSKPHHSLVLLDRKGAPQSTVIIGLPVVDPSSADYIPLTVMNSLLGGSFSSRITANIREDKGYTYSPYSRISSNYRAAYWAERADVTSAHTADSLSEILKEISRLQTTPPSSDELQGIKNYLYGVFVLINSSRGSIIDQLRYIDLNGLPEDYLNTYVQKVNAVTPEDVSAMASKYLKSAEMSLVIVGDMATVKPQLKGLDWIRKGDLD